MGHKSKLILLTTKKQKDNMRDGLGKANGRK